MDAEPVPTLRPAELGDVAILPHLWASVFDLRLDPDDVPRWAVNAGRWLELAVHDPANAHVVVIEASGEVVATGMGTLELGPPNPACPTGRAVRLANVYTAPPWRGRGLGARIVRDVIGWASSIGADRVDLSTTTAGRHLYEQLGFVTTSAPRMKLELYGRGSGARLGTSTGVDRSRHALPDPDTMGSWSPDT